MVIVVRRYGAEVVGIDVAKWSDVECVNFTYNVKAREDYEDVPSSATRQANDHTNSLDGRREPRGCLCL